jgi:hypothetical protein
MNNFLQGFSGKSVFDSVSFLIASFSRLFFFIFLKIPNFWPRLLNNGIDHRRHESFLTHLSLEQSRDKFRFYLSVRVVWAFYRMVTLLAAGSQVAVAPKACATKAIGRQVRPPVISGAVSITIDEPLT